jgi:hypothetical protein
VPGASTGQFIARTATAADTASVCGVCQCAVAEGEVVGSCPACASVSHEECWKENGGCSVYGCAKMPQTVKDAAADARPQTYWGQETKTCPQCMQTIKVAAVRCRFCGTLFESAAPVSRAEHMAKVRGRPERDSLRQATVALFVCGLIPCLGPLVLIGGGIWYAMKREQIAKLPGTNQVFCYVGLIAAAVSSVLMFVAALLTV